MLENFGARGRKIGEVYIQHDSASEFIVLGRAFCKEEIPRPGAWSYYRVYKLERTRWHIASQRTTSKFRSVTG